MVTYVKGDATKPQGDGPKAIVHVTNDEGLWGSGFVLALDKTFGRNPKQAYQNAYDFWTKNQGLLFMPLGTISLARVSDSIRVYNMTAQHRTIRTVEKPICYKSLENCLMKVAGDAIELGASVHMPRIGCGLARGNWDVVESIINRTLTLRDIDVTVYDL